MNSLAGDRVGNGSMATASSVNRDFQQILASPTDTFEEGLRFFRGKGLMNESLKRLAEDLDSHGIAYCVIGAVALNQHGYRRFTTDIDVLMTPEGLAQFTAELVGRGYRPAFAGARKKFRSTAENVPIEIIVAGEYPGDGKPKPIVFPDPAEASTLINDVKTITLEKLIELKLASGLSGADRLKDLADVQELIRTLSLNASIAGKLDPSVQSKYIELYDQIEAGKRQEEQPNRD